MQFYLFIDCEHVAVDDELVEYLAFRLNGNTRLHAQIINTKHVSNASNRQYVSIPFHFVGVALFEPRIHIIVHQVSDVVDVFDKPNDGVGRTLRSNRNKK